MLSKLTEQIKDNYTYVVRFTAKTYSWSMQCDTAKLIYYDTSVNIFQTNFASHTPTFQAAFNE